MPTAIRLQLAEGGPSSRGTSPSEHRWRIVPELEHGAMCRALGFDPVRHRFDLPKRQRAQDGHRRISGYVERFENGEWRPIGTLHVVSDADRFRDLDPVDPRDQFDLRQTK